LNQIQYFITAGCSYSAGIGDVIKAKRNPQTWSHYLLSELNPEFFYNLAIPAGGNTQISKNLAYMLETKKYITPNNTLIGINLSGLDRIDTMCAVDNLYANKNFSWAQDFGFGWITQGSFLFNAPPFNGMLQKNMELTQVKQTSCLSIMQCVAYLDWRGFDYFFMLMDDSVIDDAPDWFKDSLLNSRQDRYIKFDEHRSMYSFAKNQNLLSNDNFHPSQAGYELIGDRVYKFLVDKNMITPGEKL